MPFWDIDSLIIPDTSLLCKSDIFKDLGFDFFSPFYEAFGGSDQIIRIYLVIINNLSAEKNNK